MSVAWATFFLGLVWLFAPTIVKLVVTLPEPYPDWAIYTLRVCAAIVWFDNMNVYPQIVLRIQEKAFRFVAVRITGITLGTILTMIFLVKLGRGLPGLFEANLLQSLIIFVLYLPTISEFLRPRISRIVLKQNLLFGLPNVPNAVFVVIIEMSSRKTLELLGNAYEVGIYSVMYKLGVFMGVVAMAFRYAWQPFFMSYSEHPEGKAIFGRVLTYYLAAVGWLFLLLTAFAKPVLTTTLFGRAPLIDAAYWGGLSLFPVILFAHIFNGVYAILSVGVFVKEKTVVFPIITGIAAVVNVAGSILTIPYWGMWGAAWFTAISYFTMDLLLYLYSRKLYPIPYEWGRVVHITIAGVLIFLAGWLGRQAGMAWIGWLTAPLFPMALLMTGAANENEKVRLRRLVKRVKGK